MRAWKNKYQTPGINTSTIAISAGLERPTKKKSMPSAHIPAKVLRNSAISMYLLSFQAEPSDIHLIKVINI